MFFIGGMAILLTITLPSVWQQTEYVVSLHRKTEQRTLNYN